MPLGGSGWTTAPRASGRAGVAGLGGPGLGFSNPGGSSDSGESCAIASAELSVSAMPAERSKVRFTG